MMTFLMVFLAGGLAGILLMALVIMSRGEDE